MRWWDVLDAQQRAAALLGDDPTPDQRTAAENPYADLDMATKGLVNAATDAINGNVAFSSVGVWWQSLDCRRRRVATGDGNTDDPNSAYCAYYPGSGVAPLLGADEKTRVDTIGQALLGRMDLGVYPRDSALAMRWWNALDAAQRVAALHGDAATLEPGQRAAAERMYGDLDPETKTLVHRTTAGIAPTTPLSSVGAWWELLNCRQKRVATGDGNTDEPNSRYCAYYPGSGVTPLLGADEQAHVDTVGQALLGLMEPGVYPPDIPLVMQWWDAFSPDQQVAALHGDTATPQQSTAARNMYADLAPETKRSVNDAAVVARGPGQFDSVGAWWESLDCRPKRIATGNGNTDDPSSLYCAHYPGSRKSPTLGDMERQHVNAVGMALLLRSDPGVYPPVRERIGRVNPVLLPAVSRAILSSMTSAVSDRVSSRLSAPKTSTARLNLGGTSNMPGRWQQAPRP